MDELLGALFLRALVDVMKESNAAAKDNDDDNDDDDDDVNNQDFSCACCEKKCTTGYRYTCLECTNYELCNECFYTRKSNQSHKLTHKVYRFSSASNTISDVDFKQYELTLENLKEKFKNEAHQSVTCDICKMEPIKGLRYKCSRCVDFDVCENCCRKSHQRHFNWHPLIVYCNSTDRSINLKNFSVKERVANGNFGSVYRAVYQGQRVACRAVDLKTVQFLGISIPESREKVQLIGKLTEGFSQVIGDNILRMIGSCNIQASNGQQFVILTEYAKRGCLESVLKNEPELSLKIRFNIATGIVRGLELVHDKGYVHGRIRADAIMISHDYTAKIGHMSLINGQREPHMPPEYYSRGECTQKLDIYTLGITFNELFSGVNVLVDGKLKIQKHATLIYEPIVTACVKTDPNRRPSSTQLRDMFTFIVDSYLRPKLDWAKYDTASPSQRDDMFRKLYFESMCEYEKKKSAERDELKQLKIDKIKRYYMKELKIHESVNNREEDSQVPDIMHKLSSIFCLENDVDNAIDYANMSIELKCELVGGNENDLRVLALKLHLAELYSKLANKPDRAIQHYKSVLTAIGRTDSPSHTPYRALAYFGLGECYERLNQFKTSLENHLQCLEIRRDFYEANSRLLMESVLHVKQLYMRMNETSKYAKYRKEELKMKRELFALKHPEGEYREPALVKGVDNGRSAWHYVLVENETKYEALERQKEGARIDVASFGQILQSGWGETPPWLVTRSIDAAYFYDYPQFKRLKVDDTCQVNDYFLDDHDDYVLNEMYEDLRNKYEFNNGESNLDVAQMLLKMARYYMVVIGDSSASLAYSKKCIEICQKLTSSSTLSSKLISESLFTIGQAYFYLVEDTSQALAYFKKSLSIKINHYLSEYGVRMAFNYEYIGRAHYELEQYDKALENYFKCYDIYKKIYASNENNVYVCEIFDLLAQTYSKLNQTNKYLYYKQQATKIKKFLFKLKYPKREYFNVKLIRGKDNGRPAWHYVLIENEEKHEALMKQKKGDDINVEDYGKIIKSGWGPDPPSEIRKEIDKEYDYNPTYE